MQTCSYGLRIYSCNFWAPIVLERQGGCESRKRGRGEVEARLRVLAGRGVAGAEEEMAAARRHVAAVEHGSAVPAAAMKVEARSGGFKIVAA